MSKKHEKGKGAPRQLSEDDVRPLQQHSGARRPHQSQQQHQTPAGAAAASLPVLDSVLEYEKLHRIGEGTYGVVYKGKHVHELFKPVKPSNSIEAAVTALSKLVP